MKLVYHYDETGAYCGASEAHPSPLEEDVWLIPANATEQMPPVAGKNECPVFADDRWTLCPDHRGMIYWLPDGSECQITRVGETVPENALTKKPEAAVPQKSGTGIFSWFKA